MPGGSSIAIQIDQHSFSKSSMNLQDICLDQRYSSFTQKPINHIGLETFKFNTEKILRKLKTIKFP
jgi:hypothetical protein